MQEPSKRVWIWYKIFFLLFSFQIGFGYRYAHIFKDIKTNPNKYNRNPPDQNYLSFKDGKNLGRFLYTYNKFFMKFHFRWIALNFKEVKEFLLNLKSFFSNIKILRHWSLLSSKFLIKWKRDFSISYSFP